MTYQIKFGTDGWREIIGDAYIVDNVLRVAHATALWLKTKYQNPKVTVGYDCRFGGKMFAEYTARCLANNGITVYISTGFVSTPMISLANVKLKTDAGIIITASHNPPSYNGYKLKASYGGPVLPEEISEVEKLVPDLPNRNLPELATFIASKQVEFVDLEKIYTEHVKASFDLNKILKVSNKLVYDAMFGAGQNLVRHILPNATFLHCEHNPGFKDIAPEPILKNLQELSDLIAKTPKLHYGLATDGDADRIGFFDSKGRFIDSHHLILLIIHYLVKYKQLSGKVVKSFSVSSKVDILAQKLGLTTITTKIGFKYICKHMVEDDVLIGAEESGGIAIKGHIPERDGIWMGLVLLSYMAETGKNIEELVDEIYSIVGAFAVERYDLRISNELKQEIISSCQTGKYTQFGKYKVLRTEDIDGYKFHLANDEWVMIRASGTEPVLRVYAESVTSEKAYQILDAVKTAIHA
ncbi:MAG: phosphoglucomutase/phosphomannomutase family protein [Bacteroidia bacterium]|nr:phosphoglucomutase/phosphomannomutase family protein [Bacteroidia bacterium]